MFFELDNRNYNSYLFFWPQKKVVLRQCVHQYGRTDKNGRNFLR